MRQIGLRAVPFTEEQFKAIEEKAAAHGMTLLRLDPKESYPEDALKNCELLMGYFPKEMVKKAEHLKWMQSASAGVDKLCDPEMYPNDHVVLTNSSGSFGIAIAEYLLTGTLMLMRHMPTYMDQQKQHVWKHVPGDIGSIYGSKVTVIGLGDLGGNFAKRVKALGATVTAVKRTMTAKPDYVDALYTNDKLVEAVKDADVVAMCLPGTPQTEGMVSAEVLDAMKPGAILLNAGRGKTLDQAALVEHLKSGRLGGAVLDVAVVEPIPADDPIWDLPNVIITPHISGNDNDGLNARLMFEIYMDNLDRYFAGKELRNVIDIKKGY